MMFFWVKLPCGLIGTSRRFEEACCINHQHASLTRWLLPNNPDGSLNQKNFIRNVTAVKNLNLTYKYAFYKGCFQILKSVLEGQDYYLTFKTKFKSQATGNS
jgi:hypothetical protein